MEYFGFNGRYTYKGKEEVYEIFHVEGDILTLFKTINCKTDINTIKDKWLKSNLNSPLSAVNIFLFDVTSVTIQKSWLGRKLIFELIYEGRMHNITISDFYFDKDYEDRFITAITDYIDSRDENKKKYYDRIETKKREQIEKENVKQKGIKELEEEIKNSYCEVKILYASETELLGNSKLIKKDKCIQIYPKYEHSIKRIKDDKLDVMKYRDNIINIDFNSLDCVYNCTKDWFDSEAASVGQLYAKLNSEYELKQAQLNAKSSLKDFGKNNNSKVDVKGFVVGGILGGTAGAILGGMPNVKCNDNKNFQPQYITFDEQKYIRKDVPQTILLYSKADQHYMISFERINDKCLLNLFANKIVSEEVGENYYDIKLVEKANSISNKKTIDVENNETIEFLGKWKSINQEPYNAIYDFTNMNKCYYELLIDGINAPIVEYNYQYKEGDICINRVLINGDEEVLMSAKVEINGTVLIFDNGKNKIVLQRV